MREAGVCGLPVRLFDFETDAVSVGLDRGQGGAGGAEEGVEDHVLNVGGHADEPSGESDWVGCRVSVAAAGTWDVIPDLTHGGVVIIGGEHAASALEWCGLAVGAGLFEPEDVLDIVLDDAIGLVGLAESGAGMAFAILCQKIVARPSKPIWRVRTRMSA